MARPNQDTFPADCLVKNGPGILLLWVETKTLHCHGALPAGEDRQLGVLCSLVKAHRCEQRLLSSSDILGNYLYVSTHTLWLLNPETNIGLFIIFYQKGWLIYVHIHFFFPCSFLKHLKLLIFEGTGKEFYASEILPCLLHRQTKIAPEHKHRTQLPHVYQNILSISPSPPACVCSAGLIKSS